MNRINIHSAERAKIAPNERVKINNSYSFWTPDDITSELYLWHDLSDASTLTLNGNGIVTASDKSPNGIDVTQSTASNQPTLQSNYANGLSAGYFDRSASQQLFYQGDGFDHPSTNGPSYDFSMFYIVEPIAQGSKYTSIVSYNTSNNRDWQVDNPVYTGLMRTSNIANSRIKVNDTDIGNQLGIVRVDWNFSGNSIKTYYNGSNHYGTTVKDLMDTLGVTFRYGVNRNNSSFLTMYLGEVVFVPYRFRLKAEGYLAWKWGLQNQLPNTHLYRSSRPLNN
jgi:hypothetical protein